MFGHKKKQLPRRERNYEPTKSSRQRVFSYRSARQRTDVPFERGGADSSSKASPAKTNLIAKIQYALIAILVLLGLGYVLSLSSDAQIKIEGANAFPRHADEYKQAVNREFSSSILNRSKLTLNESSVALKIKEQLPEVKSVKVETGLLRHRPIITVSLAKPSARLITPNETYIMDSEGYALFSASDEGANIDKNSLIAIRDESGQDIEIGKPALTTDQIGYIREVEGQFKKKDINIDQMSIETGGLELHVKPSGQTYIVKFSFLADAKQSSGAYLAVKEKGITAAQYIDVRIPDHAYIK